MRRLGVRITFHRLATSHWMTWLSAPWRAEAGLRPRGRLTWVSLPLVTKEAKAGHQSWTELSRETALPSRESDRADAQGKPASATDHSITRRVASRRSRRISPGCELSRVDRFASACCVPVKSVCPRTKSRQQQWFTTRCSFFALTALERLIQPKLISLHSNRSIDQRGCVISIANRRRGAAR